MTAAGRDASAGRGRDRVGIGARARWRGGLGAWRAALRIAVREARRAKGRNALILAMIALPVLALTFAAVTYDMFHLRPAEQLNRELGAADARVQWVSEVGLEQDPEGRGWSSSSTSTPGTATIDRLLDVLPAGSRAIPSTVGLLDVRTAAGIAELEVRGIDVADPLTRGMVRLRAGRAPVGDAEIAVSESAGRRLGVGVGDRVTSGGGARTYTVVGVVEWTDALRELLVVAPEALPSESPAWLVDTPAPVTWEQVGQLNRHGLLIRSRAVVLDPPPTAEEYLAPGADAETVGGVVLVGGLGLLEVVLLAGPAFAVGARRRQHDLALVAASGGAPAHLRRIVLADGVVLGVAGAVVGIAGGVATAVAAHPLIEQHLAHARVGGYRFFPLALVGIAALAVLTGLLAALVPAYTAARQDVVATLAGRRGIVRSRPRWLALGVALTVAGGALAAFGASHTNSNVILSGVVLAELGLVLCTPALVGLVARAGRTLPLAPRIALRDTARNRAAAAPAISAVMAAVAGSVSLGIFLASDDLRGAAMYQPSTPPGYVQVLESDTGPALPPDRVRAVASADIALTGLVELRRPMCRDDPAPEQWCELHLRVPPEAGCRYLQMQLPTGADARAAAADPRCRETARTLYPGYMGFAIDDGAGLPIVTGAHGEDADRAVRTLRAGGVVVSDDRYVVDGTVTLDVVTTVDGEGGEPKPPARSVTVPGYALRTGLNAPIVVYSATAVARAGLATRQSGFTLATGATPTVAQEERLRSTLRELKPGLQLHVERGRGASNAPMLIVLAIAAGLVTLGAAAIATGLAAAESRTELSTLAAIGASPGVRRLLSLSQSGVIAGLGTVLGIVAGLVAGLTIIAALNQGHRGVWPAPQPYPLVVPWSTLAVLVAVPLVAMLGAGLLTRSRLPIERRRD
ncbi:putative ABC transport system permease protein [Micromonospora pattaloongensis]|uniref:Putative ABC transport system permease protein n=1 Tax=Micromonospora pattaloongensis TaxID=405436 RepID=A0A1H3KJU4_9ACTN|nr:ABC transporter permease [Micromonospora pattaloongensis]SDY52461.1 putative ABC transport system permease protein [Micromonospora pattaloongensis]